MFVSSWQAEVHTYSTAVRGPHHIVVLELKILIEHIRVELDLAIEPVANLFPIGRRLRHFSRSALEGYHEVDWRSCGLGVELRGWSVLKLVLRSHIR